MSQPAVQLEIVAPDGSSRSVRIDRSPFVIGSDHACDLTLAAPGLQPVHARIVRLGGAYHLLPAGAHPIALNGSPVASGGSPLASGARIVLAPECALTLIFHGAGARSPNHGERRLLLMEIARTITSALDVDEVLTRVLEGAVRFSGAERGCLFLREDGRLVPHLPGGQGGPAPEVSRSVAEEAARLGRPLYRGFSDGAGDPASASVVRLRLQAILCLPLSVRGDVIGVVYLDSRRPLPDQQPDLPLLEALADLAAVAIQNSRLVEERVRTERAVAIAQTARAIVHDLRAPLAAIRGIAEMLRERSGGEDTSRAHLGTIIAETDRLTALTGDLLQFARDTPSLQRTTARLADLVRTTLRTLQERIESTGVTLTLSLDEQIRARVDAQQLVRVLHNLVANALDAMPRGGRLSVTCAATGGRVVLAVRDSGCGMSAEVRRRAFEPFFTHGKTHGTGLGMAIVRKIVEEHGGLIRLESETGRGTLAELSLPQGDTAERTGVAGTGAPTPGTR